MSHGAFSPSRFLSQSHAPLGHQSNSTTLAGWTMTDQAAWTNWTEGGRVQSAFEENQVVSFTWHIPEAHLLREEVEHSPLPSEGERSVSAGAGKSEVWTTQPIFGDGKWKLELVRNSRRIPEGGQASEEEDGTRTITVLSIYLTSMILDYSPPDVEVPTTVMLGIRPPQSQLRSNRSDAWVWRRFYNYTFGHEKEYLECHELPSISELLENDEVRTLDAFTLTIQISTGPKATPSARARALPQFAHEGRHNSPSPFVVEDNQLVHHSLIHGLEKLIDCNMTGDVVLLVRERGLRKQVGGSASDDGKGMQGEYVIPLPIGMPPADSQSTAPGIRGDIVVRDRVLWAHSSILSARSDFFKVMLGSQFVEGQELVFDGRRVKMLRIQDADFTTVYWLLRYLYLEEVDFMMNEDVRGAALDEDWMNLTQSADHHRNADWDWIPVDSMEAAHPHSPVPPKMHEAEDTSAGYISTHTQRAAKPSLSQSTEASYNAKATSQIALDAFVRGTHVGNDRMASAASLEYTPTIHAAQKDTNLPPSLPMDPHQHPCERPAPASALSLYRLAHRYQQEGLLQLAKAHLIGTLTPHTAFAMLLAAHVYEDLYGHIKEYVLEKWDVVAQTPEFEQCCDEVSAGEVSVL